MTGALLASVATHPLQAALIIPRFHGSFCVGFRATPIMSGCRLLLAAASTAYVVSAVKLLEGIIFLLFACVSSPQSNHDPRFHRATPAKGARLGVLHCSKYLSHAPSRSKLHS
jgi:hypothetical protein